MQTSQLRRTFYQALRVNGVQRARARTRLGTTTVTTVYAVANGPLLFTFEHDRLIQCRQTRPTQMMFLRVG